MSESLSDLRRQYYGGGSAEEYAYLQAAAAAGITATDLLTGNEIDYAESTVSTNQAAGGNSNIAGLVIDVPPQETTWWLYWGAYLFNTGAAPAYSAYRVMEGAVEIGRYAMTNAVASQVNEYSRIKRMAAFSGATRQFVGNLQATIGQATVVGSAASPVYLGAIRGL